MSQIDQVTALSTLMNASQNVLAEHMNSLPGTLAAAIQADLMASFANMFAASPTTYSDPLQAGINTAVSNAMATMASSFAQSMQADLAAGVSAVFGSFPGQFANTGPASPPPSLGEITFAACPVSLQDATPDERFELLNQPGMADQSALLYLPAWQPQTVVFETGVAGASSAADLINRVRKMRGSKVRLFDGTISKDKCLVLMAKGRYRDAGLVVGAGISAGATHDVQIAVTLLPPAETA